MGLEGLKKYKIWETRRKKFVLALEVIAQLQDELGWSPNKIEYFTKYKFEYTTKSMYVDDNPFGEFNHDQYWHA